MKKEFSLLLIFILGISFIFAIPSIPNVFSGTVEYSVDSEMLLTGYEISASIGSYGLGIVGQIQEDNLYNIMIDPQGRTGEITFYIGGVETEETSSYSAGAFTVLDLTINEYPSNAMCGNGIQEPGEQCDALDLGVGTCENVLGILGATGELSCTSSCTFGYGNCSAPYCGDSVCNDGETCTTCANDCGACPVTSSGGGGGGGGGSSSGGGGGGSSIPLNTESTNNEITNLEYESLEDEKLELIYQDEGSNAPITGGVIGFAQTGVGVGLIIGIIIIFLGIGVIILRKRLSKNE